MIGRELARFTLVGITAVAIAYVIYRIFLKVGLDVSLANGIAYITGTTFSFFANKSWTFFNAASPTDVIGKFALLHFGSLVANVVVNWVALSLLLGMSLAIELAFLAGISTSTIINFCGMKFFVFSAPVSSDA
jgi:putative flippase GtrA